MIQNFVTLKEDTHQYFDTKGGQYISVPKILDSIEEPFPTETASRNCAGKGAYVGMTQDQVKAKWKAAGDYSKDEGTRIHKSLELYSKQFKIL